MVTCCLGKTENMRAGLVGVAAEGCRREKELQQSAQESSAPIVTYANDEARLNNFILDALEASGTTTLK